MYRPPPITPEMRDERDRVIATHAYVKPSSRYYPTYKPELLDDGTVDVRALLHRWDLVANVGAAPFYWEDTYSREDT